MQNPGEETNASEPQACLEKSGALVNVCRAGASYLEGWGRSTAPEQLSGTAGRSQVMNEVPGSIP